MAVPRRNPERANMVKKAHELREQGRTTGEIARLLDISPSTVTAYFADPTGEKASAYQRDYDARKKSGGPVFTQAERVAKRRERVERAHVLSKRGFSNTEIAEQLGVGARQVNKYLRDPDGELERKRKKFLLTGVHETREDAEVEFNYMELPISDKITMRPVWKRRQRRIYMQDELPPISDEEKADAIRILEDPRMPQEAPALWFDAFVIFDEGGR